MFCVLDKYTTFNIPTEIVSISLMSTTEELLERKSSGFGLEKREYGSGDLLC
jgi:hypothetical protein